MIDLSKVYTDFASWAATTVGAGVLAMGAWVIALRRKVNTNEAQLTQDRISHMAQIELIMAELRTKEKRRDEDRERMDRVEDDIRESRRDIQEIKNALIGKS